MFDPPRRSPAATAPADADASVRNHAGEGLWLTAVEHQRPWSTGLRHRENGPPAGANGEWPARLRAMLITTRARARHQATSRAPMVPPAGGSNSRACASCRRPIIIDSPAPRGGRADARLWRAGVVSSQRCRRLSGFYASRTASSHPCRSGGLTGCLREVIRWQPWLDAVR